MYGSTNCTWYRFSSINLIGIIIPAMMYGFNNVCVKPFTSFFFFHWYLNDFLAGILFYFYLNLLIPGRSKIIISLIAYITWEIVPWGTFDIFDILSYSLGGILAHASFTKIQASR